MIEAGYAALVKLARALKENRDFILVIRRRNMYGKADYVIHTEEPEEMIEELWETREAAAVARMERKGEEK